MPTVSENVAPPKSQLRENKDEKELTATKVMHGYAHKSALSKQATELIPEAEVDQDTLKEGPEIKDGSLTNELSDATDLAEDAPVVSLSLSYYIFKRVIGDRRVRALTALNLVIGLISFSLFITMVVAKISGNEFPCMYQWSEWSACSETCMATAKMPFRSRHILNYSIIRSRGKFPSCPENLAEVTERMPCNIYRCPIKLSSITNWTECFYKNPSKGASDGCYRVRDIPTVNQLIHIDTVNVTEDCECPQTIF
uniref:Uncharacterized protein n=1 Tax=Setaria digitata TaxID=48799 RepID=A0A915PHE9_9BILA